MLENYFRQILVIPFPAYIINLHISYWRHIWPLNFADGQRRFVKVKKTVSSHLYLPSLSLSPTPPPHPQSANPEKFLKYFLQTERQKASYPEL